LAYRQRQEAATAAADGHTFSWQVDTMLQSSTNHGATFDAPIQVNQESSDLRFAAVSCCSGLPDLTAFPFLGDYFGLATAGDHVYVAHTEAVDANPGEAATFPPSFHHQRLYVAEITARHQDSEAGR